MHSEIDILGVEGILDCDNLQSCDYTRFFKTHKTVYLRGLVFTFCKLCINFLKMKCAQSL
jgi:hypothetical protein